MASAKTQTKGNNLWVPARTIYADEVFDKYDKLFKLLDGWKTLENGGTISKYDMMFAVEDTPLNRQKMEDAWGKEWEKFFAKNTGDDDSTEYYYFKFESMNKLNGKQAGFLIHQLSVSLEAKGPDCWGDMLLEVVVVIIVTFLTDGTGTAEAIAIFAAAVEIGSIITRTQLPLAVQLALFALSIGSAYEAAGKEVTTQMIVDSVFQLNTLAVQIATTSDTKSTQSKLKEIQDKQAKLDNKMDADEFKRQMQFQYETVYSVAPRSIEVDPFHNLMLELDNQSIYASYWDRNNATWYQED